MEHRQYIIEDMVYEEVEEIIDNNSGTRVELIDTYGEERNRVSITYTDLEDLCDVLQELCDNGATYNEI